MYLLDNPIRHYEWGSKTMLAEFMGRKPSGRPEAELWIGAHDGDPSRLPDGRYLNEAIAADPIGFLGPRVAKQFDNRLPFLMKILAVEKPLSLQVHPTAEYARLGFAREEAAGIPIDHPTRNYKDTWHKPELIYALSRFEGFAGFRDVTKTAQMLRLLNLRFTDQLADRLLVGAPDNALRTVVTDLLAMRGRPLRRILHDVGDGARHAGARAARQELRHRSHRTSDQAIGPEAARSFAAVGQLTTSYPRDPGALVCLLLNNVLLAPREAMFVDAGIVHSYVSGLGLEVMAASDNVLRAGLTAKHIDVDELLTNTRFSMASQPKCPPAERSAAGLAFRPPVAEFALTLDFQHSQAMAITGPRIVVTLDETLTGVAHRDLAERSAGSAVLLAANDSRPKLAGRKAFATASVPR